MSTLLLLATFLLCVTAQDSQQDGEFSAVLLKGVYSYSTIRYSRFTTDNNNKQCWEWRGTD